MKVSISPEESAKVERLFFEYNASVDVLRFLMTQKGLPVENLKKYNDVIMEKNWELERAKQEVTAKYRPEGTSHYVFLFEENAIDFT